MRIISFLLAMVSFVLVHCTVSESPLQAGTSTDQPNTIVASLSAQVVDSTGNPVVSGSALLLKSVTWSSEFSVGESIVLDSIVIDSVGMISFDTLPESFSIEIQSESFGAYYTSDEIIVEQRKDEQVVVDPLQVVPLDTMRINYTGTEYFEYMRIVGTTYLAERDSSGSYVFYGVPGYPNKIWQFVGVKSDTVLEIISILDSEIEQGHDTLPPIVIDTIPSIDEDTVLQIDTIPSLKEDTVEINVTPFLVESFEGADWCPTEYEDVVCSKYQWITRYGPNYWLTPTSDEVEEDFKTNYRVVSEGSLDGSSFEMIMPSAEMIYSGLKITSARDYDTMDFAHLDSITFYAKAKSISVPNNNWIKAAFFSHTGIEGSDSDVSLFFSDPIALDTVWSRYTFKTRFEYSNNYNVLDSGYTLSDDEVEPLLKTLEHIKFVSGINQVLLDSIQFYGSQEAE
ncbi:MAG: hypothetical protein OCC49_20035 [Fibrobacterales bacterium]